MSHIKHSSLERRWVCPLLSWQRGKELIKYKDFLNLSLFVKTLGQPPGVMQLVPQALQDCACHVPLCQRTLYEMRGYHRKSWYLQIFIKKLQRNSLLIMTITAFKLQQYFTNWLDIFPEFSTLHCQYLFNLFVCGWITWNKQYEPLT